MGDEDKKLDLVQVVFNLDSKLLVEALLSKNDRFIVVSAPGMKTTVQPFFASPELVKSTKEFLNVCFPEEFEVI